MSFDFRSPTYAQIYKNRAANLLTLEKDVRGSPASLKKWKRWYAENPWLYISDWGMTYDPRLLERGLSPHVPFILWPRQEEFLKWLYERWRAGERGLVEKSRDCGVTWLCVGFAVTEWLFLPGFAAGFGSRKEELVDKKGDPKSIFDKIRSFYAFTPEVFRPKDFDDRTHNAFMKLENPETGATITGEAGDNIGRGGRQSIQFVDEAAFVDNQEMVDRALSQTTNCQIDISTPNGNGNLFYRKRMKWENTNRLFVFDWRDDPRKDQAWYDKQCEELDEVTVAQEIDRDYEASQENTFIPSKFVKAAIDAHKKLGFSPEGIRAFGFDPADVGDAKALIGRHGSVITFADQMKEGDITQAIPWAFEQADMMRADALGYDADGMGTPAMKLALKRMTAGRMRLVAYHGSGGVEDPGKPIKTIKLEHQKLMEGRIALSETIDKTNRDTYRNFRSQSWTWLRNRFEATYRAVKAAEKGHIVRADPEELISIPSDLKCFQQLVSELSRPKRIYSENGKILVESKAAMKRRGVSSPNLADAAVIAFSIKPEQEKRENTMKFASYGPAVPGVI